MLCMYYSCKFIILSNFWLEWCDDNVTARDWEGFYYSLRLRTALDASARKTITARQCPPLILTKLTPTNQLLRKLLINLSLWHINNQVCRYLCWNLRKIWRPFELNLLSLSCRTISVISLLLHRYQQWPPALCRSRSPDKARESLPVWSSHPW